jgi:hypothetical protein
VCDILLLSLISSVPYILPQSLIPIFLSYVLPLSLISFILDLLSYHTLLSHSFVSSFLPLSLNLIHLFLYPTLVICILYPTSVSYCYRYIYILQLYVCILCHSVVSYILSLPGIFSSSSTPSGASVSYLIHFYLISYVCLLFLPLQSIFSPTYVPGPASVSYLCL